MKKLYTSLVTARPPREVKGESIKSIVQELSSNNPTLMVPQEDTPIAERERALLLYDAALTPSDLPGAYGVESWALDTARIIRASKLAKDKLPAIDRSDVTEDVHKAIVTAQMQRIEKGQYVQLEACRQVLETLTGVQLMSEGFREKIKSIDWTQWESAVEYAKSLVEQAKSNGERPGHTNPGGNGDDQDDEGNMPQPDDSWLGDDEEEDDSSEHGPPASESAEAKEQKQLMQSLLPNPETNAMPRLSRFNPDPWAKGTIPKPVSDKGVPGVLENADNIDILEMEPRRKRDGARRRPEMEGCYPSGWHRLAIDRKIFRGAKIRGGAKGRGTIMVDMSVSMGWTPQDFQRLLDVLPECTIYGYSGYGGHAMKGRIVLLADRGKVAKIEAITQWRYGKGNNVVDDSCLRFLAKCSKPRIWISDGGVTGQRGKRTPYIMSLCNAAIVAGGIVRVGNAKEAKRLLCGK